MRRRGAFEKSGKDFVLLLIIYVGFVSLGLPDSVLGVAWPMMRRDLSQPAESAGLLITATTLCSVLSSVFNGYISARASCGVILAFSGLLTMGAMFGYSASLSWSAVVLLTIPLGVGQGSVDAALNSYVAKNYSARHMNWLHCCWGIGATGAPFIMTSALELGLSWRAGYAAIAAIQAALTALFFLTLKLWSGKAAPYGDAADEELRDIRPEKTVRDKPEKRTKIIRNAAAGCMFYFLYPGLEVVAGLWGASLLVHTINAPMKTVGLIISLFWGCLTAGRLITGAFFNGFADRAIIRVGLAVAGAGVLTLMFAGTPAASAAAFALLGFGCAPLYPCMMHDTPRRAGVFADKVIGLQVGAAFAGVSVVPALVGYAAARASMGVVPPIMLGFALVIALVHEISASAR